MSKETVDQNTEKQAKVMQPVELNDDKLDAVVGGGDSQCEEDDVRASGGSGTPRPSGSATTGYFSAGNDGD